MRACLAVLKDSFREALASRVLWILLIVTTLLLALAAPITLIDRKPTHLHLNNLVDGKALADAIWDQSQREGPSPGRRLWSRFSEELQAQVRQRAENPAAEQRGPGMIWRLLEETNRIMEDKSFYDARAFQGVELSTEAEQLIARGVESLGKAEGQRLNRLLLEAAFKDAILPSRGDELGIRYLGYEVGESFPVSRAQAVPFLKLMLAGIVDFFVGTLGVLAAVLVTASIMPHTFEAGSIDLLLSKPVARWLLYLTRFLGGCAFVALNATYFIVGLWLLAWWRLDLYTPRLLLCIPVFLFLFSIYFCVSAFAGAIWRNAVVSVVVTILFWAACFTVGTSKNLLEQFVLNPDRLVKLLPAGDSLLAVNEQGRFMEWHGDAATWEEVFIQPQRGRAPPIPIPQEVLGPVYLPGRDRLATIRVPPRRGFSFLGPAATLLLGDRSDAWSPKSGPAPPAGALAMFAGGGGELLIVARDGVFRLEGESPGGQEPDPGSARVPGGRFRPKGPKPSLRLAATASAALNAQTGEIAVWNDNALTVLRAQPDGTYVRRDGLPVQQPQGAKDQEAVLAFAGSTLLVALADGRVLIYDAETLRQTEEFRPQGENAPRFAAGSADGRWFAVLYHHRRLWLYDAAQGKPAAWQPSGQGDISSIAFADGNELLVTDRGTRVTRYGLDPFAVRETRAPALGTFELIYHYAVVPVYTVFPKPGELENVVSYLLTEQETVSFGPNAQNLSQARIKVDVTGPIYSSLAFVVCVLAVSCWYVSRSDF